MRLTAQDLQLRASEDLEWSSVLDKIAQFSTSEPGGRRLRELLPKGNLAEARLWMTRTQEALALSAAGTTIPSSALADLGDLVERLERAATATGPELRDLGLMLQQSRVLRGFAQAQQLRSPRLAEALFSDPALDKLGDRLNRSLDSDGALTDKASTALARAREKIREARQELVTRLKRILQSHGDVLRDSYFSERDGRYVIPVRADAHRAVEGTVLDTSASGSTLFVEPQELSPYSSRLRIAVAEAAHEERRLLAELSALAGQASSAIRVAIEACTTADVYCAITRYANHCQAIAVFPEESPLLDLRGARHPLLIDRGFEVVANDLCLLPNQALILSGPNAGGKTVTLKTLGLCAMMAMAGLPLTVEQGSRVGFFPQVFCEIGDSQSIKNSLSTFSAHVLVLASVLEQAEPGALVLLDEVAGGTDPEQGSALALAYLTALIDKGTSVASTTHYEALKEAHAADPRFRNAAVGFDSKTMSPSFRILLDVAGPSTAFAVARRFGIPDAVLERADAFIPKQSRDREALLEQLAADRAAAQALVRQAAADAEVQRRTRFEVERELESARTTFEQKLEVEYREMLSRVRSARSDLEQLRKRVQTSVLDQSLFTRSELSSLERAVDAAAHTVALGSPVAETVRQAASSKHPALSGYSPGAVSVGMRVHLPRLGCDAEVLEVSRKGILKVRAGAITLTVPVEEVTPQGPARATAAKTRSSSKGTRKAKQTLDAQAQARPAPLRVTQNTLDLRGERVDAALDRVDAFIDELLRRNEPAGFILHGHGTGVLKQAVREHVRGMQHIAESGPASPEDGGDAFTLLLLAD